MSSVVSFGTNVAAQRKRVYFTGSDVIREGMPLAYDYDATTNVLGYSKSSAANGTSTTEGYQNEGKFLRVEALSSDNQVAFAGVIAKGGEVGKAGPRWCDIFIPNGAIVPVRTDKSITIRDPLYLESGELTLVNAIQLGMLSKVATAMETVDRSSTAGIVLAKLHAPEDNGIVPGTLGIGLSELLWNDCPYKQIEGNPGLGVTFFEDFMGQQDVTTADGYVLTQVDTKGSIAVEADAAGGVLAVTSATGDSADDGINVQLTNCAFIVAATATLWFEARVKVSDATQQWFAGLCATDTTIIASGIFDDASDKVGFGHLAAGTDNKVDSITARTSAEDATSDVASVTDDTWMTIGFRLKGQTSVEFYVNGVLVETGVTAANLPTAAMVLSFVSQYETADNILSIDWVKIACLGGRDA